MNPIFFFYFKVFDLEKNSVSRTESESLDDPCARASEEGQSQETAPKNFPVEIVKSNQRRHSATPSPKRCKIISPFFCFFFFCFFFFFFLFFFFVFLPLISLVPFSQNQIKINNSSF